MARALTSPRKPAAPDSLACRDMWSVWGERACCGQPASRVAGRRRTCADSQRAAGHAPGSFARPPPGGPAPLGPQHCASRRPPNFSGVVQMRSAPSRSRSSGSLSPLSSATRTPRRPKRSAQSWWRSWTSALAAGGRGRMKTRAGGRVSARASAPCANVGHSSCSRTEALGGREEASHPPDRRQVYGLGSALEGRERAVLGHALAPQPEEGELHHACAQRRQRSSPTGDSMAASASACRPPTLRRASTRAADAHLSCRCRLGLPPPGTSQTRARRQSTLTGPG